MQEHLEELYTLFKLKGDQKKDQTLWRYESGTEWEDFENEPIEDRQEIDGEIILTTTTIHTHKTTKRASIFNALSTKINDEKIERPR